VIDLRPILQAVGMLLSILAATMLIPAAVDLTHGHEESLGFIGSALITGFAGALLWISNRGRHQTELNLRQAFLLTALSWISVTVFASLPLAFGHSRLGYVDAFFETMSGLTTTGATVIVGLDSMPPGLLLWRALLHGLGGVGIIVMALALLPVLRVGGMQLFRTESSEKTKKLLPRTGEVAVATAKVFLVLTALCTLAFLFGGMSLLDAVCHALTAVATAGFSTRDASFAHFDSAYLEAVAILFMLAGALPFTVYAAIRNVRQLRRALPSLIDGQIRWFLGFTLGVSLLLGVWLTLSGQMPFLEAIRAATFNVVAVITTTGLTSADYTQWGIAASMLFFALYFVGGCTGSTTGSIKIFRHQVLFQAIRRIMFRMVNPNGVMSVRLNDTPVSEETLASVMGFVFLFVMTVFAIALGLALTGLDFLTALSSAASAVSNVGPALGDIAGPSGNFSSFSDPAKILMAIGMLLGRLELFTLFVLLTPRFWRI
jgi:trk system potassium uptake protein TrkH